MGTQNEDRTWAKRMAVIGAGAAGGRDGVEPGGEWASDVTLIDPWKPEHVEAIRTRGMELCGMTEAERRTVKVEIR